jgi:hypothetical protein
MSARGYRCRIMMDIKCSVPDRRDLIIRVQEISGSHRPPRRKGLAPLNHHFRSPRCAPQAATPAASLTAQRLGEALLQEKRLIGIRYAWLSVATWLRTFLIRSMRQRCRSDRSDYRRGAILRNALNCAAPARGSARNSRLPRFFVPGQEIYWPASVVVAGRLAPLKT